MRFTRGYTTPPSPVALPVDVTRAATGAGILRRIHFRRAPGSQPVEGSKVVLDGAKLYPAHVTFLA